MNIARRYQVAKDQNRELNKAMSRVLDRVAAGDVPPVKPKPAGRPPSGNAKTAISLRLDPQVVEYFRSTGEGWQTRMNEVLRKAAGL